MGRVNKLTIGNYRSIRESVDLTFPKDVPLILVGENNSGKSNIVRALDLVLGESWPGYHELEDHEYYDRNQSNIPVEIQVHVENVTHTSRGMIYPVSRFHWEYPQDDERPFRMVYENGGDSPYVSKETREQCRCIVVGADRRLSYQLSYSTKYTFLARLMKRFHQALTDDAERVEELRTKFGEIKSSFYEVESFKVFAEELKNQMIELSGNLEYCLAVDFSAYDPSNYFHALRVYPYQGEQVRTFEELGTGQEQILALSFAYAYAKAFHGQAGGLILVIEEPEVHLHPLAQRWVSQKMHELAREGVQVVVTTHSPAFLDLIGLEGISVVYKDGNATKITQQSPRSLAEYCQEHGAPKASEDSIIPFYAAAGMEEILAGFFAKKIVLVEGKTEALALPVYFNKVGLSVAQDGIAIIPVYGVGNLAKWWRFFTAYSIPVYVIFDNDSKDDPNSEKRRDILDTISVSPDNMSALINEENWIIDNCFALFGVNFEDTMRSCFGEAYINQEKEAQVLFGLSPDRSKPLIARYVAERLPYDEDEEGWQKIKALADAIREIKVSI